jgi:hypothetical protein
MKVSAHKRFTAAIHKLDFFARKTITIKIEGKLAAALAP